MAQHIPGPWKYEDWDKHSLCVYAPWGDQVSPGNASGYADYRGVYICKIEHQNENECVSKAQAEANARVLSAAPELLDALRGDPECPEISPLSWLFSMIEYCKQRAAVDKDDEDPLATLEMISEVEALYRKGKAAIAKAEGRA